LKAAIELEELGECSAYNFSFSGFVSAGRFNVANVLAKFVEQPRVHLTFE
jgi:hypothetical protein